MVAPLTSPLETDEGAIGADAHIVRTDAIAYRRHRSHHGSALSISSETA
jgi:hypothetical protein